MGQYYKPIILENKVEGEHEKIKGWMYSHDYSNGMKLMEHSWMKNGFVQAFEKLLTRRGGHYKSRVVWGGDYADEEPGLNYIDEKGVERETNLYDLCFDEDDEGKKPNKIKPSEADTKKYKYIVNHSKKLFVDKTKVPDKDGWQIHPLPLLTCEGNGGGGGDFFGEDPKGLIGSWARDVISVENQDPKLTGETMDYTEIIFNLSE